MPAKVLDGNAIAERIRSELKGDLAALAKERGRPHLVSVQVGQDLASEAYVRGQRAACEEVGVLYTCLQLDRETSERQLLAHLDGLNANPEVSGIIVQRPLPAGVDGRRVSERLSPGKDVEGLHPQNLGGLVRGESDLAPCTAAAAIEAIATACPDVAGLDAVVVGHSDVVGRPVALLLCHAMATVTVCHVKTRDLAAHTRRAELLVSATGVRDLIRGDMVRPGAIVIDVGITFVEQTDEAGRPLLNERGEPRRRACGDVRLEEVREVASFVTPVPGGVGPVTVAMLLRNTVRAHKALRGG